MHSHESHTATRIPLSATRRTIARRLTEAWRAPAFHLDRSVSVDAARARVEITAAGAHATLTDELVRCCALALDANPSLNAHLIDGELLQFSTVNIGLAVPGPSGLTVPVLHDLANRSLPEIAAMRAPLVTRAREGRLGSPDVVGATFTISNLGMHGIERFDAVLNPPSVAILAVGSARSVPIVEDGELRTDVRAALSLTCDHRAVDGVETACFLKDLVSALELPA